MWPPPFRIRRNFWKFILLRGKKRLIDWNYLSIAYVKKTIPTVIVLKNQCILKGCHLIFLLLYTDVIIVEPLYRLGPFGFTYLGIPEAPGNQGFMDVVKALEWVQINIGKSLYLIWRYQYYELTFLYDHSFFTFVEKVW